MSAQMSQIKN